MKKQLLLFAVIALISLFCHAQTPILWGLASGDGSNGGGVLFDYNTVTETVTVGHNFGADADGAEPFGSLIQAGSGLLYGLTSVGGTVDSASGGDGTLFSFNIVTGVEQVLYDFGKDTDGKHPNATLLQVNDSLLYGTTVSGGADGDGTIFSYNIKTGVETRLHSFGSDTDGQFPWGALIMANDGQLYGLTTAGGIYGNGVIYNYNISLGEENIVYHFNIGNADGAAPTGALLQVGDSLLYGLTPAGGDDGAGTIFTYNIYTDTEMVVHNFVRIKDGRNPQGSLIQVGDSLLYGLTSVGGYMDTVNSLVGGVIFSYNIFTDSEQVLHNFGFGEDGFNAQGSLMEAGNGLLYGMTENGGANDTAAGGDGTIFSYSISSGVENVLYNFNRIDGAYPFGNLIEVDTTTGVKQLTVDSGQLTVYPNPSSDVIYVDLTMQQTEPVQLTLYNILGQEVYSTHTLSNTNPNPIATIPVTNLPGGVYVLRVSGSGSSQQKEVVVAR